MARHALLIGAQVGKLRGVHEDVRRMTEVLRKREFAVDARIGSDASRAGILEGLAALGSQLSAGDVGLIYYSGHGAQLPIDNATERKLGRNAPRDVQFLVPTDFDDRVRDNFRGIISAELSVHLAQLTARTDRMIAIFDCCHAARIVRHEATDAPATRGLPYPSGAGLPAHLAALEAAGVRFADLDPLGNSRAVRLFATADTSYAWEGDFDGARCGVMTEALVRYLERIGERPVSWHALATVIRERVQQRRTDQRPEVSGPAHRALFATDDDHEVPRCVGVTVRGGRAVVRVGSVAGACKGDVYEAKLIEAVDDDAAPPIARLTLDDVGPFESTAALDDSAPLAAADGVVAHPRHQALSPFAVRCIGNGQQRSRLAATPWLQVTDGDAVASAAIPTVMLDGDRWSIADPAGVLAEAPGSDYERTSPRSAIDRLDTTLANLAAAHSLRALQSSDAKIDFSVALHRAGNDSGDTLVDPRVVTGDRLVLAINNRWAHPLYVHVFAVEPHGAIRRLSADALCGIAVAPRTEHVLGGNFVEAFGTSGFEVKWPAQLPRTAVRPIDLVIVATSAETDLHFLERQAPPPRTGPIRGGPEARILTAPHVMSPVADAPAGFAVARCRYLIAPPA